MKSTYTTQICTNRNLPVKFQLEKEYHQGLRLERTRMYCTENCPLKPSCQQAEQYALAYK